MPVSWMKGADIIVCTVHIWLLSFLPLLISTMHLRGVLDIWRNHGHAGNIPAYVIEDGLAMSVFAFITTIFVFCMQGVRVFRPGVFIGERHNATSKW